MKSILTFFATTLFLLSCSDNNHHNEHQQPVSKTDSVAKPKPFADVVFASKKDLVCGMPVRAGIEDTAHYKGGIYGFCAAECKEEFMKSPEQYLKEEKKKAMKQ